MTGILPSLGELLTSAHVVALPLVTRFRGVTVREALVMRGPAGWCEFSPFTEYDDEEASTWLSAAIDFGWGSRPKVLRDRIRVNATVPSVRAEEVAGILSRFPGCRTVKVKVAETGQTLSDDVARVAAVRDRLGPSGRIRVDANGGWSVSEAEQALHSLGESGLEYAEQPCQSVAELSELRRRLRGSGIRIAADESVRKASDPLAVTQADAADILVIKAAPLGGVRRALQIVARAGLPVVVSSALDTSIGLAMGARLAACVPDLPFDCGLGTASLLAADVAGRPLEVTDGAIEVREVGADPALLQRHAASPERAEWWRERLSRCLSVLEMRAAHAADGTDTEVPDAEVPDTDGPDII